MLRCKTSYVDICAIEDLRLVGNSLVSWPAALKSCKRIPHPLREAKPFLRDKILCKASGGHIGNVQNNLAIGDYKDKHVALFRASDTVLDCGQGVIIDFPTWKAMREMLVTNKPEVVLTVKMLLRLAGNAEEEVAAGLAEEVPLAPPAPATPPARKATPPPGKRASGAATRQVAPPEAPAKRPRAAPKQELDVDPEAWLLEDLAEYPNSIRLVSSSDSEAFQQLIDETEKATVVAYDIQWSPDFDEGTDNQIALLQLAFPITGNTYVVQLPMLGVDCPVEVRRLFEVSGVSIAGFAANEIDVHKFEISGISIDKGSLFDVQPWCEAEMGENESVKQGWRVGLKRAASCVLDFEMDKTATIASSNWERDELTPDQVEYAAMDVWVALRLYQRLADAYRS
mmetsp:Transcript_40500/g.101733  ORF Transcript_40500/g.101733 Transcript_40500/m.101733 type:complete len:398 (-) Transcript_40500:325-1518(-)